MSNIQNEFNLCLFYILDETEKKVVKSLVKLCDVDPSVSNEKIERTDVENNAEAEDPKWVFLY